MYVRVPAAAMSAILAELAKPEIAQAIRDARKEAGADIGKIMVRQAKHTRRTNASISNRLLEHSTA